MIWNEEFETMPREDMETLQLKRLKDLVERVYYRVKPDRAKMDEAGVRPEDIRSRLSKRWSALLMRLRP